MLGQQNLYIWGIICVAEALKLCNFPFQCLKEPCGPNLRWLQGPGHQLSSVHGPAYCINVSIVSLGLVLKDKRSETLCMQAGKSRWTYTHSVLYTCTCISTYMYVYYVLLFLC